MVDEKIIKKILLLLLIAGLFILGFLVIRAIIIPIVVGLLFAYVFHPVYKKINRRIKRKNLSAFLLMIGITLVIAIPLALLIPVLVRQIFETYVLLQNVNFAELLKDFLPSIINDETLRTISVNIDNIIGKVFSSSLNQFTNLIINIPGLLLQFAVFLFTFFFAVRDSDKLKKYARELSLFSKSTEEKFLEEFRGITNAIIFGQVLIGIIQGLALGLALFLLGVPKALVLTVVACIVSMIPVLGSWLVWLPVGILLLISGSTFSGIFILLYGALFVSIIDNILRPIFIAKSSNLPIVVSVIGIIGGLYLFGIAGIVLGPLILAYLLIIVDLYKQGKLDELFRR